MKVIKPSYYEDFKCLAKDCPFTCCMQWKIGVDARTEAKWGDLRKYIIDKDGQRVIGLNEKKFCPLLNEDKLCKLVIKYGEDMLSYTCHTFPRESHQFETCREETLGVSCPRTLELLWQGENFETISRKEDGRSGQRKDKNKIDREVQDFEERNFYVRKLLIDIMSQKEIGISQALLMNFYLLLDFCQKEEKLALDEVLSLQTIKDSSRKQFLQELEQAVAERNINLQDSFVEDNELFLDIVDNYRKQGLYQDIIEDLALLAEEIESQGPAEYVSSDLPDFDKIWSGYEKEIRLLMCEEIYSSLVLPESDLYSMTMKLEWIAMYYSVLRHMAFLFWKINSRLDKADLISLIVVLTRIMGYSEEDIEEYMDKNFENVIWDWPYMSLILQG